MHNFRRALRGEDPDEEAVGIPTKSDYQRVQMKS
jgi:hypothetical protein